MPRIQRAALRMRAIVPEPRPTNETDRQILANHLSPITFHVSLSVSSHFLFLLFPFLVQAAQLGAQLFLEPGGSWKTPISSLSRESGWCGKLNRTPVIMCQASIPPEQSISFGLTCNPLLRVQIPPSQPLATFRPVGHLQFLQKPAKPGASVNCDVKRSDSPE